MVPPRGLLVLVGLAADVRANPERPPQHRASKGSHHSAASSHEHRPVNWTATLPHSGQGCAKYVATQGCAWTADWACPGEPRGAKGFAKPKGFGVSCCCASATPHPMATPSKAIAKLAERTTATLPSSSPIVQGGVEGCSDWCVDYQFNSSAYPGMSNDEMSSWAMKCTLPECGQCGACFRPRPFSSRNRKQCDAGRFLANQPGTCADWCPVHRFWYGPLQGASTSWTTRCEFSCCDGCTQCSELSATADAALGQCGELRPADAAAEADPGTCAAWCPEHRVKKERYDHSGHMVQETGKPSSWEMRCNFDCCSGCHECFQSPAPALPPPPSPPPPPFVPPSPTCYGSPLLENEPGVCATWCPHHRFGSLYAGMFGANGKSSTWYTRCRFDCCAGCQACLEALPPSSGTCMPSCHNGTLGSSSDYPGLDQDQLNRWSTKCSLDVCSGCDECQESGGGRSGGAGGQPSTVRPSSDRCYTVLAQLQLSVTCSELQEELGDDYTSVVGARIVDGLEWEKNHTSPPNRAPMPADFEPSALRTSFVCYGAVAHRFRMRQRTRKRGSELEGQPRTFVLVELETKGIDPESYLAYLGDLHAPTVSRLTGGLPFMGDPNVTVKERIPCSDSTASTLLSAPPPPPALPSPPPPPVNSPPKSPATSPPPPRPRPLCPPALWAPSAATYLERGAYASDRARAAHA